MGTEAFGANTNYHGIKATADAGLRRQSLGMYLTHKSSHEFPAGFAPCHYWTIMKALSDIFTPNGEFCPAKRTPQDHVKPIPAGYLVIIHLVPKLRTQTIFVR